MPPAYRTTRRVEFRETDAAGIAHFTAFFAYMEEVEHEYLRHLGLSVMTKDSQGTISWPRVAVRCDFQGAVKFEDVIDVEVQVLNRSEKSVTYGFVFTHKDRPVAEGQMTSVCCRVGSDGPPCSIPMPETFIERLS